MRVKTLEIRWHNQLPIYSLDFQPLSQTQLKRLLGKDAPASSTSSGTGQHYRLATGGADHHVRMWLVHPNQNFIEPLPGGKEGKTHIVTNPHPPRAEYLCTLSRHTNPVNVVRFCPKGETLASAGDDGNILLWIPTDQRPPTYGEAHPEDLQFEKEFWRVRIMARAARDAEVYDLAWSPTGEYFLAGSTDNTARIFSATDGSCVYQITEHSHYVQGVAWDPLGEYIATQSSDRSLHVHSVSLKHGQDAQVHALSKVHRADVAIHHRRTPSFSGSSAAGGGGWSDHPALRPRLKRRGSTASDAESAITTATSEHEFPNPASASTSMQPPVPHSRRSSVSTAAAASPPLPPSGARFGRSPSPVPPLPAIKPPPLKEANSGTQRIGYGDEAFTQFFRRLSWSPDGALLITPSGQFEDTSPTPPPSASSSSSKKKPAAADEAGPKSTVFIYSRGNLARAPVAHLPGHRSATLGVRFSPILYNLRSGLTGAAAVKPKEFMIDKGKDYDVSLSTGPYTSSGAAAAIPSPAQSPAPAAPTLRPSPARTPSGSASADDSTPVGSLFALPYRMLHAVVSRESVVVYDTQQAGPIAMFTNLHWAGFTDVAWSPDGQALMLASQDGYCSLIVFDPTELGTPHEKQQHHLQLSSLAAHTQHPPPPVLPSPAASERADPIMSGKGKERETPSASESESAPAAASASTSHVNELPVKKKRKVELTRVGDVGS